MKKTYAAVLAVLLTAGLFAAGTKENANPQGVKPVTLRFSWWGADARHKATLAVIELYKQKNPHVTIEAEYGGVEGYQQKLFTQLASGNAPDIIQVDAWWPDAVIKFDAFTDLGANKNINRQAFDADFVKNYGTFKNTIYALPTGINAPLMLENLDVLQSAGLSHKDQWTWDDILNEGAKINRQNPARYFYNLEQYTISWYIVRPYLSQLSGTPMVIDATYELGFNRDQLVEVYTYLKKLFDQKVIQPPAQSMTYKQKAEQNPVWINGNAAATMNWTSKLTDIRGKLSNLNVTPIPVMASGAKNTGMFSRPSQLMCINKKSASVEESAKFLDFFFNDPQAQEILKDVRSIPPTSTGRNLLEQKGLMDPLMLTAANNAFKNPGVSDCIITTDVACIDIVYDEVENIAFGKTTPEQSADKVIKALTERLAELKKAAQ